MRLDGELFCPGDAGLAFFYDGIAEFLDATALQADEMVVVLAFVQLEYRLSRVEDMALKKSGLFELLENPVNRRQADVFAIAVELAIYVLGAKMPARFPFLRLVEQFKNPQARDRKFEAGFFEIFGVGHITTCCAGTGERGTPAGIGRVRQWCEL